MKSYLFVLTILLLASACRKPTSLYEELRADDKLEAAYHFNASTLRMLNFQNDSSVNALVKGVQKLSLLSMKESAFSTDDMFAYSEQLQQENGYELYLEISGPDMNYYILGDQRRQKTVALVAQEKHCYLMDISGRVNFMELPNAIQAISQADTSQTSGFSMLFDLVKEDADREERRREHRRKRAEEEAKNNSEEQISKDSTVVDSLLLD